MSGHVELLPPEALHALLAPRIGCYGHPAAGGIDRISEADAALLSARIRGRWPHEAWRLVRLGDESRRAEVERELWLRAVDLASAERWRLRESESRRGDEVVRKLALVVVDEAISPVAWGERPKWLAIGRCERSWYATWQPRYRRVGAILWGWVWSAEADLAQERGRARGAAG